MSRPPLRRFRFSQDAVLRSCRLWVKSVPVSLSGAQPVDRRFVAAILGVGILTVIWAVLGVSLDQFWFARVTVRAHVAVESIAAFSRLFGGAVLFMFPASEQRPFFSWIAAGFLTLGLGNLLFGFSPLIGIHADLNLLLYASLLVRCIGTALFALGLLLKAPAPLTWPNLLQALGLLVVASSVLVLMRTVLPQLIYVDDLALVAGQRRQWLASLSGWHFSLSMIPLALAIAAVIGATQRYQQLKRERWLLVVMMLHASGQFHSVFWPSIYSSVITSTDLLRLAIAVIVAAGSLLELRWIANEWARSLAIEQENTRRLTELALMKADFSAMVAHELANPLSAIRALTSVLATGRLGPEQQAEALESIKAEATAMTTLVADVTTAASAEKLDFEIRTQVVHVRELIENAAAFAVALPGDHPVAVGTIPDVQVRADRYRIGQVLRNLVSNAVKYTPPGTPIELRVSQEANVVLIEVIDQGPGIEPSDLARIFEKFARGRDQSGQKVPGVGLGLYVSRLIVRGHQSELRVQSTPGVGSNFSFQLEIARG